jgi:hypothetical protein
MPGVLASLVASAAPMPLLAPADQGVRCGGTRWSPTGGAASTCNRRHARRGRGHRRTAAACVGGGSCPPVIMTQR